MVRNKTKDALNSIPMPELQAKLGSSPEGLSQAEAQKRLTQYGPNEIEELSPTDIKISRLIREELESGRKDDLYPVKPQRIVSDVRTAMGDDD
ncbi:MAG: cation-transporting P-type ATPase, partial [Acidobacteriota bacterium]